MKLSWFNKSMGTHKLYLAYEYVQYKAMQDIREIGLRDSGSNANNKICFEVRATALVPVFTQKDFYYVYIGPSTKGSSPRNYNSTQGVHNSSPKHKPLHKRGQLAKFKVKKNTLGDHKDHKQSLLVILKDHKQFSHKTKILKIRIELIAQLWENKVFWKRKHKENTWEKL